jgi:hypothetical protein
MAPECEWSTGIWKAWERPADGAKPWTEKLNDLRQSNEYSYGVLERHSMPGAARGKQRGFETSHLPPPNQQPGATDKTPVMLSG